MRMSAAAKRKIGRIEKAFEAKPHELEHIYLDTNLHIRDRHVEAMFRTCFYGEQLDDIFQHNFTVYFEALAQRLLPDPMAVGPEVFADAEIAKAWITRNFGINHVKRIDLNDPILGNSTFRHCTHEAILRAFALCPTAVHHCYAPSKHHAILLTVVNLYRELVHNYHEDFIAGKK